MEADEVLAARAVAGSRAAFDELIRRYRSDIYQLTRILTRGDDDAEDLVQDTFVRAFRGIARFRGESSFRTWLHSIAVNVVRTHATRRRDAGRLPIEADGPDEEPAVARAASREDLEATVVRRQIIDRALATLSADARLVVTLRDIQGLEYQEIAQITGVPLGTIESRLFRARRRLRPLLAPLLAASRHRNRV